MVFAVELVAGMGADWTGVAAPELDAATAVADLAGHRADILMAGLFAEHVLSGE